MTSDNQKVQSSSSDTRDLLLKEAAKLFSVYGYERTTMRNIASATGIKLGSIAYYFKSKEDILFATMSAVIESGEEKALATLHASDDVKNKLQSLIEVALDSLLNSNGSIVVKEWRSLQKKYRTSLIKRQQVYEDIWSDVLAECHAKGIIRSKPEIARRVLHGAFAWPDLWKEMGVKMTTKKLAREIMLLITHK